MNGMVASFYQPVVGYVYNPHHHEILSKFVYKLLDLSPW